MKTISQRISDLPDQRQEVELHVSSFNEDKVKAVKLAREATPGLGLAEAKAFIEGTYNIKAEAHSVVRLAKILEGIGCELQVAFTTPCQSCDCASPEPKKPDLVDLFEGGVRTALGYAETLCPSKDDCHRRSLYRVFVAGGRKAVEDYIQEEKNSLSQHQKIVEQLSKSVTL